MTAVFYPFGADVPTVPSEYTDDIADIAFGLLVVGYIVPPDEDIYQAYLEYCEDLYGEWRTPNHHIDALAQLGRDLVNNHYLMTA